MRWRSTTWSSGREVLLAAGAIGSPHLLMLSGVGPAAQLRAVGVDVVVDLPGVGENLHDHGRARVRYSAARPLDVNTHMRRPVARVRGQGAVAWPGAGARHRP